MVNPHEGPSNEEMESGDGIQAVDISRIMEGSTESDPSASKEALEGWEIKEFGDKGNDPIDEEERFRLVS